MHDRTFIRKVVAVVAGLGVFAAVSAYASTLRGMQTGNVGANSNAVASSITKGVSLDWAVSYTPSAKAYTITGVTVSPVSKAETIATSAKVWVTLTDSSHKSLGEYTSSDGGRTYKPPSTPVPVAQVANASVVINGGAVTVANTTIN